MAKRTKQGGGDQGKRQGRRVIPALRRRSARVKQAAAARITTLGDLIAAAFDAAGSATGAAKLLGSADIAAAIQKRIVVV